MVKTGWSEAVDVELERIDDEPARSMRAEKLTDLAAEYAECLKDLPPIRVIAGPNDQHWCCDGCTRLAAYRLKGRKFVPCQIKRGTFEDAWREAARANTAHGARVTNRDKRAMVERALKRFPGLSNRALAELCGVVEGSVRRLNCVIDAPDRPAKRLGRDGKEYSAPKPRPRPEPEPEPAVEPVEAECEDEVEQDAPEPAPTPPVNDVEKPCDSDPIGADPRSSTEPTPFDPQVEFEKLEAIILETFESWPNDEKETFGYKINMLCIRLMKRLDGSLVNLSSETAREVLV